MTIELKVPFMVKDEAVAFQKYLSQNGCDSRLITETRITNEVEYTATIGDFEAFLASPEMDDVPDDQIEHLQIWIASHKADFNTFYTNHNVGVAYSFDADDALRMAGVSPGEFAAGTIKNDEECKKQLDKLLKLAKLTTNLRFLERNGCVKTDSEKHAFTLLMKKPVEDIEIDFPDDDVFDIFDCDELREYGIRQNLYAEVKYQYMVVAGPKFILLDEDDLYDYLATDGRVDLMYFENVFDDVQNSFDFYRRILEEIIPGNGQLDKLISQLSSHDDNYISYQVDADYLVGVLTDLKKLGLVTIKNGVINPTKALLGLDI